jgi:hypothetical protein
MWLLWSSGNPLSSTRRVRAHPIELFGAERRNFESNFPVDKMGTGYATLWNAFKRITAGCSQIEKLALYTTVAFAGPMVRIHLAPPESLRTIGPPARARREFASTPVLLFNLLQMTGLIGTTFHWLGEQLSGGLSTPD